MPSMRSRRGRREVWPLEPPAQVLLVSLLLLSVAGKVIPCGRPRAEAALKPIIQGRMVL